MLNTLVFIGISALVALFLGAVYFFPLTVASIVAAIYLTKVGMAGYHVIFGSGPTVSNIATAFVVSSMFLVDGKKLKNRFG